MGHKLHEWTTKVAHLIRDAAGKDINVDLEIVGLRPAFAQFSTDRPYELVVESVGAGSSYFDLPLGWVEGVSSLASVEYPARANPPSRLDDVSWRIVRKTTDPTVKQVLLLDRSPTASEYVWFTFSAPWPYPDNDETTDQISDIGFEAVGALAASFCLTSLAAEAARSRSASIPTNYVDGARRAQTLVDAAATYRDVYNRFLGLATSADGGGTESTVAPAHGRFDFDPSYASLYHGGRR